MPRKRKPDSRPFAPILRWVLLGLKDLGLSAKQDGESVVVRHGMFTRIEALPPTNAMSETPGIIAVLRVKTELSQRFEALFAETPELLAVANERATLGALTNDCGKIFVGSRLPIYENEGSENLYFSLVLHATINGYAVIAAIHRVVMGEGEKQGDSEWHPDDMHKVYEQLSRICVCTTGGFGLTAEIPLKEGAVNAALGDHHTTLWQLHADQPHPEMGGGLFCILQMPHQVKDEKTLAEVVNQLNRMEWSTRNLSPHFGAWCRGRVGMNPAYVSFLPNACPCICAGSMKWQRVPEPQLQ